MENKQLTQWLTDVRQEDSTLEFHKVTEAFYSFCFDLDVVKQILGGPSFSSKIKGFFNKTESFNGNIIISKFKHYAENRGINVTVEQDCDDSGIYYSQRYKSVSYWLKIETSSLLSNNETLMILSNNFAEFEPKYLPYSVATKLIIKVSSGKPVAIYVVVKTPMMSSTILRNVDYDGSSLNLGRINNDDVNTVAKFINDLSN